MTNTADPHLLPRIGPQNDTRRILPRRVLLFLGQEILTMVNHSLDPRVLPEFDARITAARAIGVGFVAR